MVNKYVKIQYPEVYYHNIDLLAKLFRQHGGNPIYYISEYRDKIRCVSNQNIIIEEDIFTYTDNIIELLKFLDRFFEDNL